MYTTFTSESVCAGHPDKICDQISDAIVDSALSQDKFSRVALETMVSKNFIALAGEVTTKGSMHYTDIARKVVKNLGYTIPALNFTYKTPVIIKAHTQSPEIAQGVDKLGAGDQGMMFGFACSETPSLMPLPIMLAHELVMKIDDLRKSKRLPYLRPDGKTQVTAQYDNRKPVAIETVVLAVPHKETMTLAQVKEDLYKYAVIPVLQKYGYTIKQNQVVLNGTGAWYIGGPTTDTGVTGRKIIVDSYGSFAHVGGGAFSGKDPTKVDRSAAYAARFLAKNIVAHGLAAKCEVRLAYFIGALKPVMQEADTFGTAKKSDKVIKSFMDKILDTSLKGILEGLDLRRPIYFKTAAYGHFGREGFPWERIVK